MSNLIKDIASVERPYEKAVSQGVSSLSDAELLAVIIRNGTKNLSSIDLSNKILNTHYFHKGLAGLNYINREDLCHIKGIGDAKATQILAVAELAKRMNNTRLKKELNFNNPDTIALYYMEKCKYLSKERMYLMLLSSSHMLIKELLLSEGTINAALFSPREIFIEALRYEAVNIILVHNHPSGNPEPSEADILATRKIYDAGLLMDIHLSDHIIVGNGCYVSMMERGIIE
ncbi:MAG: DNA repair protein RadC [Wujia sp.]